MELEIEQEESYGQQLVEVHAFSMDQKCNFARETVRIREYLRETVVSARMVFWERAAKLVSWILKKIVNYLPKEDLILEYCDILHESSC